MAEKENKVIDNPNVNLSDEEREGEDIIKDSYDDTLTDPIKEAAEIDKVDNKIEISAQQIQKMQENIIQNENLAKAEKEAEKKKEAKAKENDEPKKGFWASLKEAIKKVFNGMVNVAAGALHLTGRVLLGQKGYDAMMSRWEKEGKNKVEVEKEMKALEKEEKDDAENKKVTTPDKVVCSEYSAVDKTKEFHIQNPDKNAIACCKVNELGAIVEENETKMYIPTAVEQSFISTLLARAEELSENKEDFAKNLNKVFNEQQYSVIYDEKSNCIKVESQAPSMGISKGYMMDLNEGKMVAFEKSDKISDLYKGSKEQLSEMVTEVAKKELERKTGYTVNIQHTQDGKSELTFEEKHKTTKAELLASLENGDGVKIEDINKNRYFIDKNEDKYTVTNLKDGKSEFCTSEESLIQNLTSKGIVAKTQTIVVDNKNGIELTDAQKDNQMCKNIVEALNKYENSELKNLSQDISKKVEKEKIETEINKLSSKALSIPIGGKVEVDLNGCSISMTHTEGSTVIVDIISPDKSTQESVTGVVGPNFSKEIADKIDAYVDNAQEVVEEQVPEMIDASADNIEASAMIQEVDQDFYNDLDDDLEEI